MDDQKRLDTDKLRAEWARGSTRRAAPRASTGQRTHWDGCHLSHWSCAIARLCDELDALREAARGVIESSSGHDCPGQHPGVGMYMTICPSALDDLCALLEPTDDA